MKPIKLTLATLLCAIFFFGCKKEEDVVVEQNNFIINGITDLVLNSNNVGVGLQLKLVQKAGPQERIALTSEGLPAALKVSFLPEGGIPEFNSSFSIIVDGLIDSGTYVGKIIGKSKSITREYEFQLKLPAFSILTVAGSKMRSSSYFNIFNSFSFSASTLNSNDRFTANSSITIPEGTSTYALDGSLVAPPNAMKLTYKDDAGTNYNLVDNTGKVATVTKDGDKILFEVPEVELTSNTNQKIMVGGLFIK